MVYEPIQITGLNSWIAQVFGVDLALADVLTVFLVVLMYFMPLFLLSVFYHRDNDKFLSLLFVVLGVMVMGALTGIGWLPAYSWVLMVIYISVSVVGIVRGFF
jgi:hypothetical protein